MADLSTTYLGLKLNNPIIVGSSGLSNTAAKVKELEDNGAAAVVLKSIFEEEIVIEMDKVAQGGTKPFHAEALDYYGDLIQKETLGKYTSLIAESKKKVSVPVIASVNCMYSHEWVNFAKEIESAGADALELNMFFLPADLNRSSAEQEQLYFDVVGRVLQKVSIPVALKIGNHFSNLALMIRRLSEMGIAGLVLFNRFYTPDFDIDHLKMVSGNLLSTPAELGASLRWIAMMSGRVKCDLCASTGIHDGAGVIKQLLAGAKAVEVVSVLYQNGTSYIRTMLKELDVWMTSNKFKSLDRFRGKMSQSQIENPAVFERVQFMKYAGGGQIS
jgi:dihydroorotate dehydrogenase (fumarate)